MVAKPLRNEKLVCRARLVDVSETMFEALIFLFLFSRSMSSHGAGGNGEKQLKRSLTPEMILHSHS